jgi:hypothetical protein
VALSNCTVPFRSGQELRPLDLRRSGQIRSSHTGLVSDSIRIVRSRSNG